MTSRGTGRRAGAAVGAVLLVLLAGCGADSDGDGPGPGEDASSPSSTPPSVRVPTAAPVVEPADGPLLETEGATLHALKGMFRTSNFGVLQGYRDDQLHVSFVIAYSDKPSLDAAAKQHERIVEKRDGDVLERADDVVVGGKYNAFHFLDTSDPTEENHTYGVLFLDGSWIINIGFYDEKVGDDEPMTAQEREEATARILASFEPTFN